MTVFILFALAVLVGAVLLAHHMGVEYGYEHGYNDARHDISCPDCRMSDRCETLDPSNTNQSTGRKYQ